MSMKYITYGIFFVVLSLSFTALPVSAQSTPASGTCPVGTTIAVHATDGSIQCEPTACVANTIAVATGNGQIQCQAYINGNLKTIFPCTGTETSGPCRPARI